MYLFDFGEYQSSKSGYPLQKFPKSHFIGVSSKELAPLIFSSKFNPGFASKG
jgi:hypothetical protein